MARFKRDAVLAAIANELAEQLEGRATVKCKTFKGVQYALVSGVDEATGPWHGGVWTLRGDYGYCLNGDPDPQSLLWQSTFFDPNDEAAFGLLFDDFRARVMTGRSLRLDRLAAKRELKNAIAGVEHAAQWLAAARKRVEELDRAVA
jgi:hypothetical protein